MTLQPLYLERMEIFDARPSRHSESIRRVTLRHAWHDVYLSWDQHLNVRGCSGAVGGRNEVCLKPPYWYLEQWRPNTSRTNVTACYKLRTMTSRLTRNISQQVAYAHVTRRTWQLRLQTQRGLLIRGLASAARRVWVESIDRMFPDRSARRSGRLKRGKERRWRCNIDHAATRSRLSRRFQTTAIQRRLRQSLKRNSHCLVHRNSMDLLTEVPWKKMSVAMKSALTCHVGAIVRDRLRAAILGLGDNRCVRGQKWGNIENQEKRRLLNQHLTRIWLEQEKKVYRRVMAHVNYWLDNKITSFCAEGMT